MLEKEKLTHVLELFIGNQVASVYKIFYQFMKTKNVNISYAVGSTSNNAPAQYDRSTNKITFRDIDGINFTAIVEEYVHVLQDQFFYINTMGATSKNCEFEAKVFADICNFVGVMESTNPSAVIIGVIGQTSEFTQKYKDWINDLVLDRGAYFTGRDAAMFRELCSEWTAYGGSYSSSFDPRLLKHFFNRPIQY